jgi:hypothetical protein
MNKITISKSVLLSLLVSSQERVKEAQQELERLEKLIEQM